MAAAKEAIGVELRVSVSVAALRDLVRLTNSGLYGLTPERTAGELLMVALRAELLRERQAEQARAARVSWSAQNPARRKRP